MPKISKAEAGYQFHPDSEYVCGSCVLLKDLPQKKNGCAWFGPAVKVSATSGACNYFSHGHPGDQMFDVPWFSLFTPIELGYLENKPGFGCKRCEHADLLRHDCSEVDKDSPGDTPGEIHPGGCCNLWEADKKRGKMSRDDLEAYLEALPGRRLSQLSDAEVKDMPMDEYEKRLAKGEGY